MAKVLSTELAQRVVDLKAGISSAPASIVSNQKEHLLDLFKAIDLQAAEITRLEGENASLRAEDTEVIGQ